MSDYSKLKELAEATKGWDNLKSCWPEETEDGDLEVNWFVGAVTEDDDKYPVLEVNTAQYDALEDAGRLARYYAAANPSAVAALIAENERLQGCEDVLRQLASHVGAGGYNAPEVDPETFARKIMDGINILNDPMAQLVIKKGEQIDQLRAEVAGLRTGYEAYEQVNAELKAEVEGLRKDSESYRLLSFCHGQGTLELVRSHHELCAEIRRLKILAGEPVPQTPEEFVGPSPEGLTARIRRKLAALGKGEQS